MDEVIFECCIVESEMLFFHYALFYSTPTLENHEHNDMFADIDDISTNDIIE